MLLVGYFCGSGVAYLCCGRVAFRKQMTIVTNIWLAKISGKYRLNSIIQDFSCIKMHVDDILNCYNVLAYV